MRGGPAQVALWLIVALLAAHAAIWLLSPPGGSAIAQPAAPPSGGVLARAGGAGDNSGVFLVPGQIDKDVWGAYLVDTRAGTVVLYQYNPNSRKLKLVAARTFVYDRYLEDYNTDPPTADIRSILENVKRKPDVPDKGSEPVIKPPS